jgi:hypothetical protein
MSRSFSIGALLVGLLLIAASDIYLNGNGYASASLPGFANASQTVVPTQEAPLTSTSVDPRAIPPGNTGTTLAKGARAITPPVTEDKIRSYVAQSKMGGGVATGEITVADVQFMPTSQLQTLMPDEASFLQNFAPDTLVVYVRLKGNFAAEGPSQSYTTGFRVFDAVTGNELMGGAGPK